MGRVEFTRPWPPLQAPHLCLLGCQEGELAVTKSLLGSPFRALELSPSSPHCPALLAYW